MTQRKNQTPLSMLASASGNAARKVPVSLVDKWNVVFLFFMAGWIIGWISHSYACTPWYNYIG